MVPWLTRLPVYQVLAALLTFQMAPGEKVIVSSEYKPSQTLAVVAPVACTVMPLPMVRPVLVVQR